MKPLCQLFTINTSSYYYRINHKDRVNLKRERLKQLAIGIHTASRGSAGQRTIAEQLTQAGEKVGRHKAKSLMKETNIQSKQPYKVAKNPLCQTNTALHKLNKQDQENAVSS